MKAMKSMKMKSVLGSLKRKPREEEIGDGVVNASVNANSNGTGNGMSNGSANGNSKGGPDTPEANATKNVRSFCESGGPQGSGEEVLYLPAIVESAESSPAAAKECAYVIRKFLSKDNFSRPYVQYNAIMLIRILADNPGKTFTRNFDAKFVDAVKELLRFGRDPSVKQILMETLDTFSREKADDEGLAKLIEMWKKEHERIIKNHGSQAPLRNGYDQQNYFARNHHIKRLPSPQELVSRIEEAKTSAKLLSQLIQSTPPSELLNSDLVKEFADRCQSASRSIQAYMIAEDPSPDNDTMETLIETNEQLGKAMSQHQRAVVSARKAAGLGNTSTPPLGAGAYMSPSRTESGFAPPPGPPPSQANKPAPPASRTAISKKGPQIPPSGDYARNVSDDDEAANPFSDPQAGHGDRSDTARVSSDDRTTGEHQERLGYEPYHPGFGETQSHGDRQGNTSHAEGANLYDEDDDASETVRTATKATVYRY